MDFLSIEGAASAGGSAGQAHLGSPMRKSLPSSLSTRLAWTGNCCRVSWGTLSTLARRWVFRWLWIWWMSWCRCPGGLRGTLRRRWSRVLWRDIGGTGGCEGFLSESESSEGVPVWVLTIGLPEARGLPTEGYATRPSA